MTEGDGSSSPAPDLQYLEHARAGEHGSRAASWFVVILLMLAVLGVGYALVVWP